MFARTCPKGKNKNENTTWNFEEFLKLYLNPADHPNDTIPDFVTNVKKIKEIIAKLICPSIGPYIDKKIGELIKQMVGVIKFYNEEKNKHLWLADGNDSSDWKDRDKVFEEINKYSQFNDILPVEKITFFSDKEKAQKKTADLNKGIQKAINPWTKPIAIQ